MLLQVVRYWQQPGINNNSHNVITVSVRATTTTKALVKGSTCLSINSNSSILTSEFQIESVY